MLVVGPAKCDPCDMFRCKGLPGLGADLATSDDKEANMSVGLPAPNGGSCSVSSEADNALVCLKIADCSAAFECLDLLESVAWRSSIVTETLLSSRPLLGRLRLETLPGGKGRMLLLVEPISCFTFPTFARLPSVMRRGSSSGVHGQLPVKCIGFIAPCT